MNNPNQSALHLPGCCTAPVETIAANGHLSAGECCLVPQPVAAPVRAPCPASGSDARRVAKRTIEHLLTPSAATRIARGIQYYYCEDPRCDVVYFSKDGASQFMTADVRVAVFAKDVGEDVNVCYCFDWTRRRLREEIDLTEGSTAARSIANNIRTIGCACDIKNPSGRCCLGDVNRVVAEIVRSASSGTGSAQ
jgi:hypothetical protein